MEPRHGEDMPQLEAALKLLNQADPFVEVTVQESGEHVLGAAGAFWPVRDLTRRALRSGVPGQHCSTCCSVTVSKCTLPAA